MEFFGWLVPLYILVALICWSVFGKRFLSAKDIRRPRNVDVWDGFGPVLGVLLLASVIIMMNPGRFVRTVGKSMLWPVTLWRWFNRSSAASDPAPSPSTAPSVRSGLAGPTAAPLPTAPGGNMPSSGQSIARDVPPGLGDPSRPSAPSPRPSVEKHVGPAPARGAATWVGPGASSWGAPGGAGRLPASPRGSAPRMIGAPPPLPPRGPSPGRHSNF